MIIVQLMGGHSNQMFQYATARSLAIQHNTKLLLSMEWFKHMEGVKSPRVFELDGYNIIDTVYKPTITKRLINRATGLVYYEEKNALYDPSLSKLGSNVYLHGNFQSEKYFKDIRPTLLQDFSYKELPSKKNAQLLKEIEAHPQAVSLHIRRGDYVQDAKVSQVHGMAELDYYVKALKHLKKTVKNPKLYVISNDVEWCKQNLKFDAEMVIVDNNNTGAEDMRLMRACKHNILANSSFSWWGAWLNENPDKIIIAPKKWYNDTSISTADLIPDNWVKL